MPALTRERERERETVPCRCESWFRVRHRSSREPSMHLCPVALIAVPQTRAIERCKRTTLRFVPRQPRTVSSPAHIHVELNPAGRTSSVIVSNESPATCRLPLTSATSPRLVVQGRSRDRHSSLTLVTIEKLCRCSTATSCPHKCRLHPLDCCPHGAATRSLHDTRRTPSWSALQVPLTCCLKCLTSCLFILFAGHSHCIH